MDIINMSSKQITSNITLDSYNTSGYLKIVNYFNRKIVLKKIDPIRCDEVISKVLFLNRYKNLMPSNFVIPKFLVLLDNKDLYMAIDYINDKRIIEVSIIPLDDTDRAKLQKAISAFNVKISFRNPKTNQLESNVNCIIPESGVEYYTIQVNKVMYKAFKLKFIET